MNVDVNIKIGDGPSMARARGPLALFADGSEFRRVNTKFDDGKPNRNRVWVVDGHDNSTCVVWAYPKQIPRIRRAFHYDRVVEWVDPFPALKNG